MKVEVCYLPFYDDLGNVDTFFRNYERQALECQRMLAWN